MADVTSRDGVDGERRIARAAQACQRCRALKARCRQSETIAACQKCDKAGVECVWTTPRSTTKRKRSPSSSANRNYITRHDDIRVCTSQREVRAHTNEQTSPSQDAATVHPDEAEDDRLHANASPDSLNDIKRVHNFSLMASPKEARNSLRNGRRFVDTELSAKLSTLNAAYLYNEYRSMAHSFPFVIITQEMTFERIREEKPMLLLAIMTAASWRDRKTQISLEKTFRTELADRMLLNPAKDMVLLQSILIYLAWSHFYIDPKLRMSLTILHMAVSLLSELQLRPPSKAPDTTSSTTRAERQRFRVVLGCYFLSSSITSEIFRPRLFDYSGYMDDWCRHLSQAADVDSDHTIALLIESRRLLDGISDMSIDGLHHTSDDVETIRIGLNLWREDLTLWDTSGRRPEQRRLLWLLSFALDSKFQKYQASRLRNLQQSADDDALKQQAVKHESSQYEACKQFLDEIIAVPNEMAHLITMAEWGSLPTIIMETARINISNRGTTSRSSRAWNHVQLDLYLDSLCYRMQSLTTHEKHKQNETDFWMVMKTIMHSANTWYRRQMQSDADTRPLDRPFRSRERNSNEEDDQDTANANKVGSGDLQHETFATILDSSSFPPGINLDVTIDIDSAGFEHNLGLFADGNLYDAGFWSGIYNIP